MKFSRLKRATDSEVEKYLIEQLELSNYQAQKMRDREIIRFSHYRFYKDKNTKSSALWRLTLPLYVLYWVFIAFIIMPVKWLITGNRYLSRNFLDNFHYRWVEKIGI